MKRFRKACWGLGLLLSTTLAAAAAPVAGTASIVAGTVTAVGRDGLARTLAKGDPVYSGERIVTAAASYVRLGFLDGGSMVLRPESDFSIVNFRYQAAASEPVQVVPPKPDAPAPALPSLQVASQEAVGNAAFFKLVRGGFRAVSGLIGKVNREEYAVATPVATMGIRGTVFWSVACDAVCAADPLISAAVPSGELALGGTVSAVDQGQVLIVSSSGQAVTLNASQYVLTTASGTHVTLSGLPGFLSGEQWLGTVQETLLSQPAASTSTAVVSPLEGSVLSTLPTVGGVAAAVLLGAVVLATDGDEGGSGTSTSTTTSTARPQ